MEPGECPRVGSATGGGPQWRRPSAPYSPGGYPPLVEHKEMLPLQSEGARERWCWKNGSFKYPEKIRISSHIPNYDLIGTGGMLNYIAVRVDRGYEVEWEDLKKGVGVGSGLREQTGDSRWPGKEGMEDVVYKNAVGKVFEISNNKCTRICSY